MKSETQKGQEILDFQISKRILQNKLTSAKFDISRATLLQTLNSFSTKLNLKNKQFTSIPFMTARSSIGRKDLSQIDQQKGSFYLEKSPFLSLEGTPSNQQKKKKSELQIQIEKDGKFKLVIEPNNYVQVPQNSHRYNTSLSQTQKSHFMPKRKFSHEERQNKKNNDSQKHSLQQLNKTQTSNHFTINASPSNTSYNNNNGAIQIIQDFHSQNSRINSENNFKNPYLLNTEEFQPDFQKNLTERLTDKEKNMFEKSQRLQDTSQKLNKVTQNDTQQIEEKLHSYLSYLGQNFKNESSSKRVFKNHHKQYKEQTLKTFYSDLQNELSESKQKKVIVPKLQKFAKKVQNLNSIMNFMDKKYQKEKELQIKKKKLLEDAKNINTDFFNFDSIIQNFCYNLQQFIQLNRNKAISTKKIQKLYGFNQIIKNITFDDLSGELRSEFNPAIIHSSIKQMLNIQEPQIKKQSESLQVHQVASLGKIKKKNELSKQEILKSIYYFNKTLEEINNEKITENRNNQVAVAKQEAEIIQQKLQDLVLQNRVNSIDKKGIFQELKKGIVYNNGNPFYRSSIPLNNTILKSEKSNGQFDLIMFKNRYQSTCIDNICDQFQQF
ncbi:hypothetical protein TTHERM_01111060 (macronuclear) [Tetrahymena thermophila SB210]|uniref:Uncharacterized protein n=1 Tax=Tetrahymena thermophila (strain SB210) TaxID=312017 RepID=Q24D48_TETTS|nr:hypothetical protein TTHERM_01111060 [Tetrahymena thermophila SB210]EAS05693.2 hypothetical protein TTHERM_01111060 [Tetrahymena thermophila SB210]|eukprot:XP_001025938.2 hypothetical protein TTHERM_01111060 [Tetrahymena thermophila SB210]